MRHSTESDRQSTKLKAVSEAPTEEDLRGLEEWMKRWAARQRASSGRPEKPPQGMSRIRK